MEGEILSGQPIQNRRQALSVDLDAIVEKQVERVKAVVDGTVFLSSVHRVAVLDSGINPELSFGASEDDLSPLDTSIVNSIGELPELPEPSDDLEAVLQAWELWIDAYKAQSLSLIESLNAEPPPVGKNRFGRPARWGTLIVKFGEGIKAPLGLDAGAEAIRDTRAAYAWKRAAAQRFSPESVAAGEEATAPTAEEGQRWITAPDPSQLAGLFLRQAKRSYMTAKAHEEASRTVAPDFDTEMARWAKEQGSDRLKLALIHRFHLDACDLPARGR